MLTIFFSKSQICIHRTTESKYDVIVLGFIVHFVRNKQTHCCFQDYDQFDMANEVDTLEQFLKVEVPPEEPLVAENGTVSDLIHNYSAII